MRFGLTEEQTRFRDECCQFLRRELTSEVARGNAEPTELGGYSRAFAQHFFARLGEKGYIGIGWPGEYGGGGKDMVHQVIFCEEMAYHRAPYWGPTLAFLPLGLIEFGTEEQKRFFLPLVRQGKMQFFVGYSEPEAGSDLSNLRTRAVLEGDEFVVNGQKLFSSGADRADYGWLAVRTDPTVPKHKGISLLLVDMKSPGVSVARYKTMAGWWHHGVYLDNVRVPRSNLVGELSRGWYHIMALVDYERATVGGNPGHVMRLFDELLSCCTERRRNGVALIKEPTVRNTLADLAADVRGSQLLAYWVASMHAKGLHPQHEASLVSLFMREAARKIEVAHLELLGPYAQLTRGSTWAPREGSVESDYRHDAFFHFAAGGFDITRNVIAARGLQLPRG